MSSHVAGSYLSIPAMFALYKAAKHKACAVIMAMQLCMPMHHGFLGTKQFFDANVISCNI